MILHLDPSRVDHYQTFLRIKDLPVYRFQGRTAEVPDEYAHLLTGSQGAQDTSDYEPAPYLFDYQRDIAAIAIRKRRFAVFAQPGLGKTGILLEFARHVQRCLKRRRVLIVSPLMVIPQTMTEAQRFYGDSLPIERIHAADLQRWLNKGSGIGITNYEAIREGLEPGKLGALILDESSLLKSHYGAWGQRLISLARGIDWKLCLTGTPAPNDRIEYGNHAVLLDQFPTVNSFLARYFVNRGQTDNRWELKPHALRPFYRSLSHWCIFLENPATYGWKDNAGGFPPITTHIHDVDLTDEQARLSHQAGGDMFGTPGGIGSRARVAQLAKGWFQGAKVSSNKPAFIRSLLDSWLEESTILWCKYNAEQDELTRLLPGTASIAGDTPQEERERIIGDFQSGRVRTLITKPKILGMGLNLQIATRQIFSTLQDSFEEFFQAVKRSNRVGSTRPLEVHIPITALERPMVETVLRKAHRVQLDAEEQERLFKEVSHGF